MLFKYVSAAAIATGLMAATMLAHGQDKQIDIQIRVKQDDKVKPAEQEPFKGSRPSVDVAVLLDTSNSMDGLISQAKSQLWNIVQQFAEAKKQGKTPILRVAVFEYGNTRLPASEGYIRQVIGLTDDLDKVSEALFQLTTSGGDEYCGQVIGEAIKRLDWSKESNGYKAIFIAGNEPFTQGPVNYRDVCKLAIQKGVVVNTIHCGNRQAGISGMWEDGARIAEGEFLNIDQDRKVIHIKCPQDKIIIELNTKLNKTYLWYGSEKDRKFYAGNQIEQDSNAMKSGGQGNLAQRASSKISGVYRNVGRDLVDTYGEDKKILSKVKDSELPENMQKMTEPERKAYVEKLLAKRNEIKKQLGKLNRERAEFVAKEKARMAKSGEKTLGDAVILSVQKQLKKSGFEVNDK